MQTKQIQYAFFITIAIAGIIIYNPFLLYFQNDDFVHIPLSAAGVLFQHNSFRPVCDLSIMLDYKIWGKNASGYHLTNLLLHIFNCILVFILSKKINKRYNIFNKKTLAPAATAILFFIYANHSEATFWILGRSAMMGFLFFALSCIFYLDKEKKINLFLSICFAMLAFLSYESTWILPLVFVLIELVDSKYQNKSLFKSKGPLLVGVCFTIYLAARQFTIHEIVGNYEAGNFLQLNIQSLALNYIKLFCRGWLPAMGENIFTIAGILIILLFTIILFLQKKNWPAYSILFALYKISLVPAISIGASTNSIEGERFLYLPSFFICAIILFLITQLKTEKLRLIIFTVLIAIQLFILNSNAKYYQLAGAITKTFTNTFKQLPAAANMVLDSVPQEFKGALIFRLGLAESIKWFSPQHSLLYSTQKHNELIPAKNYTVKYLKSIEDIPGNKLSQPLQANTVYLRFTDSALLVYKN